MRVLVVEDEALVAKGIVATLHALGYLPEVAGNGEEAWFKGSTEPYAAIVLDIGLPGLDGMTILKRWRSEGIATPVLVLTSRGSWAERVDGIDSGADDYLPKPFRMEELIARLKALIRRAAGVAAPEISVGLLTLNLRSGTAFVDSVAINLTPLEFRLLQYLLLQRGRTVSQSELSDVLYSTNSERDSNAIEALVRRLRTKLKADIIQTKRGFGYCVAQDGA